MNPGGPEPPSEGRKPVKKVKSRDLFEGGQEVVIEHGSEEYRLRITKSGKLILTK